MSRTSGRPVSAASSGVGFKMPNPIGPTKPSFRWRAHKSDFGEVNLDPVMALGYNMVDGGTNVDLLVKEIAGHQQGAFVLEGDYQRPDHVRQMEMYPSMESPNGEVIWRPYQIYAKCFQSDGVTAVATRQEFIDNFTFTFPVGGTFFYEAKNGPSSSSDVNTYRMNKGTLLVVGSDASNSMLQLGTNAAPNGPAGGDQPSALDMGFGGVASVFRIFTQNTTSTAFSVAGTTSMRFFKIDSGFVAQALNVNRNDHALSLGSNSAGATYGILALRRKAGLTANMLGVLNDSDSAVLSRFNYNGQLITKVGAAPALGDLTDGEGAFWVDPATGNLRFTSRIAGALKNATVAVA